MKKVLLAAFAASMIGTAFGATYGGTCDNVNLGTLASPLGTVQIKCPDFNVLAGEELTSYQLTFFGTYAGASTEVADQAQFTFNLVSNGSFSGFTIITNPFTTSASPIPGPEPLSQIGGTSTTSSAFTNLETGLVTGATGSASFQAITGFVDSSNFNFTLVWDAASSPIPTNGEIPEPSSIALIGAGLVGLGALARRRR